MKIITYDNSIFGKDWTNFKQASEINETTEAIYQIEKGVLYNENGEEVFDMKALIRLFPIMQALGVKKIPIFRNAIEANAFLEKLEKASGEKLGRVPNINYLRSLRYKDTNKEKQEASIEDMEKRNKRWESGDFVN